MDELLRAGANHYGGSHEGTQAKPPLLARLRGHPEGSLQRAERLDLGPRASRKIPQLLDRHHTPRWTSSSHVGLGCLVGGRLLVQHRPEYSKSKKHCRARLLLHWHRTCRRSRHPRRHPSGNHRPLRLETSRHRLQQKIRRRRRASPARLRWQRLSRRTSYRLRPGRARPQLRRIRHPLALLENLVQPTQTRHLKKTKMKRSHETLAAKFLALSLLRRPVPHLLLNPPLPARLSVKHQRHLSPRINHRLSARRLNHLVFRSPFGSPIAGNLYIVKIYFLVHDFISRHFR